MELSILNKCFHVKRKLIIFLCFFLTFSTFGFSQIINERIYANTADASSDDFLTFIKSGYVENTNASVDSDLKTFASLNSTTVNLLGIPVGGSATIRLNFNSVLPANTPVTIKLGIGGDVLSALSGVTIQGINGNATNSSEASGNEVGDEFVLGDLVGAVTGEQQVEVTIAPNESFNGVKISLGVPKGILNAGVLTSLDVYEAYYEENIGNSGCIEPEDAIVGIEGELLNLNLLSALDIIQNPYNAIDGDQNSAALLRANVSALTSAYLNIPFNGDTKPGDQIQIILEDQAAGLLDLGLLSSNFQIIALNNDVEVQRFNASSTLLSLELLSGSSSKYKLTLPVSQSFDEIEIRYAGSLATVVSGINIYEVGTTPSSPVISSVDLNDGIASICEGEDVTLSIENPVSGSVYNWYSQAVGGTAINTGTDFTPKNLNAGIHQYYVAQSRPGCTSESARVMATIEVEENPDTPVLVDSDVEVASGGDVTLTIENPDSNITYNWYAKGDGTTVIHTGETYTITNVTAAASYTVVGVSQSGCESAGATVTVSLLELSCPQQWCRIWQ